MRVMIPVSGGLDSTVLLHETLRNTRHEVVALYYTEDYSGTFAALDPVQREAAAAVVAWLKANVRAFTFEVVPVRKVNANNGRLAADWRSRRYASHGYHARERDVAQVWLGLTTWNQGREKPGAVAIYRAYTGARLVTPFRREGLGRCSVRRRIDPELWPLIVKCHMGGACGSCTTCRFYNFYDFYCPTLSADELKAMDQRLARLAKLGDDSRWHRYKILQRDDWGSWIRAGADPDQ